MYEWKKRDEEIDYFINYEEIYSSYNIFWVKIWKIVKFDIKIKVKSYMLIRGVYFYL